MQNIGEMKDRLRQSEIRKAKLKSERTLAGAPAGIRTPNQQIMSLLL